jgi:hypothetical protein
MNVVGKTAKNTMNQGEHHHGTDAAHAAEHAVNSLQDATGLPGKRKADFIETSAWQRSRRGIESLRSGPVADHAGKTRKKKPRATGVKIGFGTKNVAAFFKRKIKKKKKFS